VKVKGKFEQLEYTGFLHSPRWDIGVNRNDSPEYRIHWIPAFAGMTAINAGMTAEMQKTLKVPRLLGEGFRERSYFPFLTAEAVGY
jgi:hypothetical protein